MTKPKNKNRSESQKDQPSDTSQPTYNISTSNSYQPLNDLPPPTDNEPTTWDTSQLSQQQQHITPIIIETLEKDKIDQISHRVAQICKKKFTLKYLGGKVSVRCSDIDDHGNLKNSLKENSISFHTFTLPKDKDLSLILKGLAPIFSEHDILNEIKSHIPTITSAIKIKTPNQEVYPIYQIKFHNSTSFEDVRKLNFLFQLRIYWEKYTPHKVTQCYRCQLFGHGQLNCNRPPNCYKCGEPHLSAACKKPKSDPPKCANCKGQHLSYSKICPAYQAYIGKFQNSPRAKNKSLERRPFIMNIADFPQIAPGQTRSRPPEKTNHWKNQEPTSVTVATEPPPNITEFQELLKTLEEINSICNIKNMLNKTKTLLLNLKNAKNESEKLELFISTLSP